MATADPLCYNSLHVNPTRRILLTLLVVAASPPLLARPAAEDHFLRRIRETAETQPYVEKGFEYYRDEIPQVFKDPDQERVALEAVKLLILFAILPVETKYTARHMAEMVLFRVTDRRAGASGARATAAVAEGSGKRNSRTAPHAVSI